MTTKQLLLCGCAAVLSASLRADTIPPYEMTTGGCTVNIFVPGGCSSETGGAVNVTALPAVSLSASQSGVGNYAGAYSVFATFAWDVKANGGNDGDAVPVLVSGVLRASSAIADANSAAGGLARLTLNFANGTIFKQAAAECDFDCPGSDWQGTLTATAWVGYQNIIGLDVSAGVEGNGFAATYADPYVYIDPAFLADHPGYSLEFSPGVGNGLATSTPEPSTLLLTAVALAALVGTRCRT
jgi:hypothetical protein